MSVELVVVTIKMVFAEVYGNDADDDDDGGQKTYLELGQELNGVDLLMVKVDCPLEVLKKREMARGDRKTGLAESQYESIHEGVSYDLIVNTFSQSTKECARLILGRV